MSNQPKWKFVANLGDADPIQHGGLFVFIDETGVYPPEMERLEMDYGNGLGVGADMPRQTWTIHRVQLEKCSYVNGVLSENEFHPDHPAWFAKPEAEKAKRPQDSTYLSNVASYCGLDEEALIAFFCSDDPIERASAYESVFSYHGWENGDSYPLTGLTLAEVEERYDGIAGIKITPPPEPFYAFPAILSVEARLIHDDDSGKMDHLGEFREPKRGEWYIDRATGVMFDGDEDWAAECPEGGVSVDRGQQKKFVCGPNHVPHNRRSWAGLSKDSLRETIRQHGSILNADIHYAFEDWKRAEAYGQSWHYVGVATVVRWRGLGESEEINVIEGGSLWGIEDDSGPDYFLEVGRENFEECRGELEEAGFSAAEIDMALSHIYIGREFESHYRDEEERSSDPGEWALLARKAGFKDDAPIGPIHDRLLEMADLSPDDAGLKAALKFAREMMEEEANSEKESV